MSQITLAESQSQEASMPSSPHKETLMEMAEPPAELPHDDAVTDMLTEASVGPGSQDMVQIHTWNDDLD